MADSYFLSVCFQAGLTALSLIYPNYQWTLFTIAGLWTMRLIKIKFSKMAFYFDYPYLVWYNSFVSTKRVFLY